MGVILEDLRFLLSTKWSVRQHVMDISTANTAFNGLNVGYRSRISHEKCSFDERPKIA